MNRFVVDTEAGIEDVRDVVIHGLTLQKGHLVRITEVPFPSDAPPPVISLGLKPDLSIMSWAYWRIVLQVTATAMILQGVVIWIASFILR